MEIYTKNYTVNMSEVDNNAFLREIDIISNFLDCATAHGKIMGVAAPDLDKHNLFWVITKNKFRFFRKPMMLQDYTLSTWPEKPQLIRSNRYCELSDSLGILAQGKTEWVMLDKNTFRVAKLSTAYPSSLAHSEKTLLVEPWLKVDKDFSSCNSVFNYKVNSLDIDISNHMNNIAYLRAMFNCFSTKVLKNLYIYELEIHYISQCFEGDNLSIKFVNTDLGFKVGFFKDNTLCTFINVVLKK